MHVHGDHLNLNALLGGSATNRTVASQGSRQVQKKLATNNVEQAGFDDAFDESLSIEEEAESGTGERRRQQRNTFRAADASEDEGASDHHTSFWA